MYLLQLNISQPYRQRLREYRFTREYIVIDVYTSLLIKLLITFYYRLF